MMEMEKKMDTKEAVLEVLKAYGCKTSQEISFLCHREFGVELTPSQVAGALRALAAKGKVGSSKCGLPKTVYWATKEDF